MKRDRFRQSPLEAPTPLSSGAYFVHYIDERADMIDGCFGENAVTEVKDVPRPPTSEFENLSCTTPDLRGFGE